jgi:quercetin dioxygenase-like cupin family protein
MTRTAGPLSAEVCLPSTNLTEDLSFFTETLGFRLDTVYPADDPAVATLSGHGLSLRLERGSPVAPGVLRLLCRDPDAFAGGRRELVAPNGVRIHVLQAHPPLRIPPTEHAFLVRRLKDNTPWVIGRAGMQYRDLIPGRLGGSIIASHIRIPDAGPVPDMVHYHTVGFQLIYCYSGWVRLVYEDQGPPFALRRDDCVIQPPRIRHRVLEASDNLQVIEIGVPAEHVTTVDHEMDLPTRVVNPDRDFDGQRFCRSETDKAVWQPWRLTGFEARETGIGEATGGVASVRVARWVGPDGSQVTSHSSDILFTFVLSGSATLHGEHQGAHALAEGDAYVIPPDLKTSLSDCSSDLRLLEVSLPARFETRTHAGTLEGLEA